MALPINLQAKWLEHKVGLTATLIGFIAAVAGGVIGVESRYAHAGDVQIILKNQQTQIDLYRQHQIENSLFQLEFYNQRIRRLEDEKRRSQVLRSGPSSRTTRALTRDPSEIDADVAEAKAKKEYVERTMKR